MKPFRYFVNLLSTYAPMFRLRIICLCAGMWLPSYTYAHINPDSLALRLKTHATDSVSILRVIQKAVALSGEEYNAKIVMLNWGVEKSKKHGYPSLQMDSYVELGWVYSESHDKVNAIRNFSLGRAMAEKLGRREDQLGCLSTIASIYFYSNQTDKAREIYEQILVICRKYNIVTGLDNVYSSLGTTYYTLSENDTSLRKKAIAYMKMGQEMSLAQNDTTAIVSNYQTLSRVYLDKNQYDSALHYADLAFTSAAEHHIELALSSLYMTRGMVFEKEKKYTAAIENYDQGLTWASKFHQAFWMGENYQSLAECYAALGDYKNAYEYFQRYTTINDSIQNTENFAKAADIQNKYEREKKERLILQLNKNNEIKRLKIEKQSQFRKKIYFIIAGVTLMGMSLIILIFFQLKILREKRESYHSLQLKNINIQQQSGHLAYQARLIARYQSQMNPHFIFNAVNNIQGLVLTGNKDKSLFQLDNFKLLMQQTLEHSEKDYITLLQEASYLQQYVAFEKARFIKPFEFTVHLPAQADMLLVPPMIIQPFIENAIKHAALHTIDNSFITVRVSVEKLLHISITDNGKGFDMQKSNVLKKGHAIDIIRSRIRLFFEAENINMTEDFFSVKSIEGSGTTIHLILPLRYA